MAKSKNIVSAVGMIKADFPGSLIEEVHKGTKEICCIITIAETKIGVESTGDPSSRMPQSLKLFVEKGCSIIVCATRTSGATVAAVEALESEYSVVWIEKTHSERVADQKADNQATATRIVREVKEAMKK